MSTITSLVHDAHNKHECIKALIIAQDGGCRFLSEVGTASL